MRSMMDIMEGQQKDARIAELERKLSAALGAVDFWQTAHEQAEAALERPNHYYRQVMLQEKDRAERAEAERDKWEWVARHEWRCPLGEMNPGEPGSHIVERGVSDALLDRWQPREG